MVKLEDLGLKVKKRDERHITRPSQIPVGVDVKEIGDKEALKSLEKKWDEIKKQEKIDQIRLKKLQNLLDKKQEQVNKENRIMALKLWEMIDYITMNVLEDDAYRLLEWIRKKDPLVYRKIFPIIIEPRVVKNAEKIAMHIYTHGFNKPKVKKKTILGYYNQIRGNQQKE